MSPVTLPDGTGECFYEYALIMTPEEYRRKIFLEANITNIEASVHADNVQRLVQMGLTLVSGDSNFKVVYTILRLQASISC